MKSLYSFYNQSNSFLFFNPSLPESSSGGETLSQNSDHDIEAQLDARIQEIDEMQKEGLPESDRQLYINDYIEPLILQLSPDAAQKALHRLQSYGLLLLETVPKICENITPLANIIIPNDTDFDFYFSQDPSLYLEPGKNFSFKNSTGETITTTLQQQSQQDALMQGGKIFSFDEMTMALNDAVLDGLITKEPSDPEKLYYLLQNGCKTSDDVELLQKMLIEMDSELAETIEKDDNKYGYKTSRGVRKLVAFLSSQFESHIQVELAALHMPEKPFSVEKPIQPEYTPPSPPAFGFYEEIIVGVDPSASITKEDSKFINTARNVSEDYYDDLVDDDLVNQLSEHNINLQKPEFRDGQFDSLVFRDIDGSPVEVVEPNLREAISNLNTIELKPGEEPNGPKTRLIELWGDEQFQFISQEWLDKALYDSNAKNTDVVFKILKENPSGDGTRIVSVPLSVLKRHFEEIKTTLPLQSTRPPIDVQDMVDHYMPERKGKNVRQSIKKYVEEEREMLLEQTYYDFDISDDIEGVIIETAPDAETHKENIKNALQTYKNDLSEYQKSHDSQLALYKKNNEEYMAYLSKKEAYNAAYENLTEVQKKRVDALYTTNE